MPAGERGWITIAEACALFSPVNNQYAFGEMDDVAKRNLAEFAALYEHPSSFDFMPTEGRIYFIGSEFKTLHVGTMTWSSCLCSPK